MPEPPLSPSQQVERIREILVGRQMQQVEERLERLERLVSTLGPEAAPAPPTSATGPAPAAAGEVHALRRELQEEAERRNEQITELGQVLEKAGERLEAASSQLSRHDDILTRDLGATLSGMNSSMATRIDARVREVLDHMQGEIDGLREQLQHQLQRVQDMKADRTELRTRFSRLASAAMEEGASLEPSDGFLP